MVGRARDVTPPGECSGRVFNRFPGSRAPEGTHDLAAEPGGRLWWARPNLPAPAPKKWVEQISTSMFIN
jgi:hypothetical protein